MSNKFPKGFWKGLAIIFLVYTLLQLMMHHPFFGQLHINGIYKQVVRWVNIFIVYLIGALVLQQSEVKWMSAIWHLIHLVLIGYLFSIAGWEYLVSPIPYGLRASVAPIVEFLISPVLYLGSGVLYYSLSRQYSE